MDWKVDDVEGDEPEQLGLLSFHCEMDCDKNIINISGFLVPVTS